MTDTIVLTMPTSPRLRGVATLVLGGIGSRLDLPYEKMDDLQLAVLSVLAATDGDTVTIEVTADDDLVAVGIGPLSDGSSDDGALTRVLERLVDTVEAADRDGGEWLMLRLFRAPSAAR
jgi:anti-sigma regulatory factor (Ser/Thr protein kinase)